MFAEIVFYIQENPVSGFVYEAEHGYTALQNTMQKIMALLNWLSFIKEGLL